MYEDENNLYHYSYRKGDEQNPNAPIDTKNYAEDDQYRDGRQAEEFAHRRG